jgi:hypothetical protein
VWRRIQMDALSRAVLGVGDAWSRSRARLWIDSRPWLMPCSTTHLTACWPAVLHACSPGPSSHRALLVL